MFQNEKEMHFRNNRLTFEKKINKKYLSVIYCKQTTLAVDETLI